MARLWQTLETESSVKFVSPEGFTFEYGGTTEVCEAIARIIEGGSVSTAHGEVLDIIDGDLVVLKHDPWTNRGFNFQDCAGNVVEFGKILVRYLKQVIDART